MVGYAVTVRPARLDAAFLVPDLLIIIFKKVRPLESFVIFEIFFNVEDIIFVIICFFAHVPPS